LTVFANACLCHAGSTELTPPLALLQITRDLDILPLCPV